LSDSKVDFAHTVSKSLVSETKGSRVSSVLRVQTAGHQGNVRLPILAVSVELSRPRAKQIFQAAVALKYCTGVFIALFERRQVLFYTDPLQLHARTAYLVFANLIIVKTGFDLLEQMSVHKL
jgi:hypothetical protein